MSEQAIEKKKALPAAAWIGIGCLAVLLILVAVGIIAGGAIGVLSGVQSEGKRVRVMADFAAIESAMKIYESRCLRLPTTAQGLNALVTKPAIPPIPRNWGQQLKETPLDPWGNEYGYRFPGKKKPDYFDLFSAGPDGVLDTADDIGNWESR